VGIRRTPYASFSQECTFGGVETDSFGLMSDAMSEQAIEFLQEWIDEKVRRPQPAPAPAPLEKQAEILCLKCQADAAKAGVPLDEIVEEVGDLEDLISAELEDAERADASPPPDNSPPDSSSQPKPDTARSSS
jgi:hypothetical protein